MAAADVGDIVTDTTLALELPHPEISSANATAAANKLFLAVHHFMYLFPFMDSSQELPTEFLPHSISETLFSRRVSRTCG